MTEHSFPDWLRPLWLRATADPARLPHAILLAGPAGSGNRLFGEKLAQRLLCERPDIENFGCGECPSCRWLSDANHPDMHRMVPASADEDAEAEGAEDDSGRKEKKKSDQIRIEQVREMQSLLEVSGHQGGRRIVLIDPAEAMNTATANALLKSLEEPPIDAVFLLISHAPRRLLPTIRSRCQVWDFPRPDPEVAEKWLARMGIKDAHALLGFVSGLPLAAMHLSQSPLGEARERFARDMSAFSTVDPLKLAGEWEAWLKSKAAAEAGLNLAQLVSWLQRWLSDGARLGMGGPARFFRDHESALRKLVGERGSAWMSCYNELLSYRKVAQHPLNQRLFLEDVLLRVARGTLRTH